MTAHQIAVNASALRNLADRLEHLGYKGDTYAEAELLAMNLLADGYKPVERAVPATGGGSSPEARAACKAVLQEALVAAKAKRSAAA